MEADCQKSEFGQLNLLARLVRILSIVFSEIEIKLPRPARVSMVWFFGASDGVADCPATNKKVVVSKQSVKQ